MNIRIILVLSAILALFSLPLHAASITITQSSANTFVAQGSAMDGVSGIELTIHYDSSSLSGPSVGQGSLVGGAMMAANTNLPGSMKIAIISTKSFGSSGQIATISFGLRQGNGGITGVSASLIDSRGNQIPVQASYLNDSSYSAAPSGGFFTTPGIPFSQPTSTTGQTQTTAASTSTGVAVPSYPVVVPIATEATVTKKDSPLTESPSPAPLPLSPVPEKQTPEHLTEAKILEGRSSEQKSAPPRVITHSSVLERFRTYQGEKTPAIFTALFKKDVAENIRQIPSIALSDGKSSLRIQVDIKAKGDESPNFSLTGAKIRSLSHDDQSGFWNIEALPRENAVVSMLTVLTSTEIIEYPLTIAPPMDRKSYSAPLTEEGFTAFLKDQGTDKAPKHDLNGDKRRDYIDEYIYTLNYLMSRKEDKPVTLPVPAGNIKTPVP